MILTELKIHYLRNIASTQLGLHPRFNFYFRGQWEWQNLSS
ncbi:hypothetical protein LDG_5494 [Legionella drancourtii LLAP12]|uniref:Uncharacterized protein n=1 Tax=Legionella drancourtii LLAP12 TaxID=658187 RepID=G9EJX5_9GAMM|nr:hypothetical protein LDG_5494 [Legionella drancourtii LLAP12]